MAKTASCCRLFCKLASYFHVWKWTHTVKTSGRSLDRLVEWGGVGARSFQQGLNWARRVGNGVLLTWGTEDSSVEEDEKAEG